MKETDFGSRFHNSGILNTETLLLYSQVEHTAETKIAGFLHTVMEDLYKLFRCCAAGRLQTEALAGILRVYVFVCLNPPNGCCCNCVLRALGFLSDFYNLLQMTFPKSK